MRHENRLALEKSPYLLQHSKNPVNWYPWGREAFDKALQEDKPILLSVGYSTCHWCHVMAQESFEDEETAKVLNEDFVCIKVDREERPDIDAVYMKACQAMTGAGGWPMTVFMTPEQKPFFAGTYFPKHSRYGQPGLIELSHRIAALWKTDRDALLRSGESIAAAIASQPLLAGEPRKELLQKAYEKLCRSFDKVWGGFGSAPKFPTPHNLLFLLQYGDTGMVNATLSAMARGGIFDQIGGGFCRYSTDEKWLIPHFEKMLYDNALLILAYTEAYERTKDITYSEVAEETVKYVLQELRSPNGAYYCGQDADSDGKEGAYYYLTSEEVVSVLGENEGRAFCRQYGIGDKDSVPNLIGRSFSLIPEELRRKLYVFRRLRHKLHTDRKILLSWNAWLIIAFCRCGHLAEALEITEFIEARMNDNNRRLFLRYCDGEAANEGQLDDYAVYALALLFLYRTTLDVRYLEQAIFRAEQILDLFEDNAGGCFLTAHDAEQLIDRPKESYDGAVPSGNSVTAMVLEVLAQFTGEIRWRLAADRQMRFLAGQAEQYPAGHCFGLLAMSKALRPSRELVVCGTKIPQELKMIWDSDLNVLFKSPENAEQLAACAKFTENYPIPEAGISGYLCENGVCRRYDTDIGKLISKA